MTGGGVICFVEVLLWDLRGGSEKSVDKPQYVCIAAACVNGTDNSGMH